MFKITYDSYTLKHLSSIASKCGLLIAEDQDKSQAYNSLRDYFLTKQEGFIPMYECIVQKDLDVSQENVQTFIRNRMEDIGKELTQPHDISPNHMNLLFPDHPNKKVSLLRISTEGRYSITPKRYSQETVRIIKDLHHDAKKFTILDGTANVGGDSLRLAMNFKRVISVEMSHLNHDILISNIKIYKLPITVYKGDITKLLYLIDEQIVDLLYLDPPWGGKEYMKQDKVNLFLSGIEIKDVVLSARKHRHLKYIVLKLPSNFDFDRFAGIKYQKHQIRMTKTMYYIVTIDTRNTQIPEIDTGKYSHSGDPQSMSIMIGTHRLPRRYDNDIIRSCRRKSKERGKYGKFVDELYKLSKMKKSNKKWGNKETSESLKWRYGSLVETVKETIPEKSRILDYGCGDGVDIMMIKEVLNSQEAYCLDVADNRESQVLPFILNKVPGSLSKEIEIDSIDLVVASHSLHHISWGGFESPVERLKFVLAEITKIVRPGGFLLIREHDVWSDKDLQPVLITHMCYDLMESEEIPKKDVEEWVRNYPLTHEGWYTSRYLLNSILGELGWKSVKIYSVPNKDWVYSELFQLNG